MHHIYPAEVDQMWAWEQGLLYNASAPAGPGDVRGYESDALLEHQRGARPILLRDVYARFAAPILEQAPARDDWDNLSDDRLFLDPARTWEQWELNRQGDRGRLGEPEQRAHETADACARACHAAPEGECFQWAWREDGRCAWGRAFKVGRPVKGDSPRGHTHSGWDIDRIRHWAAQQGECERVGWPQVPF